MDFSREKIPEILKYSLPKKFQDMTPLDFEDFAAQLFKDLGYTVEQTSYSGDYGADLILSKAGERVAVQIKRYGASNNVGVKDVNQVVGARDFYKCNKSMIITTSDFTNPAVKLLEKTQTEKWNWDDLQKVICDTYLNGKDIYQYSPNLSIANDESVLRFDITKVEYNKLMEKGGNFTLIYATLKNNGANTFVTLEPPIFISQSGNQVQSIFWYTGYFNSGTVYSGCAVEVAFMYSSDQVKTVSAGDRIIFNLYQDNGERKTFDTKINIPSFGGGAVSSLFCKFSSGLYSQRLS